ncbi:uncharacterized protein LOC108114273 [Drosophila eugracilis]|uniref:uncharacterized protein LOC108114273 n=1 Tax=Drosophila eugracilis TaxID=29029 RepID=UPI0007E6C297|nr:uncharacterized protein LOC108114273 [Drosophila eugracilis]
MSNSSRHDIWVPSPAMMLHQLQSLEEDIDESVMDFHESCNRAWRSQFSHPAMARLGVGFEFVTIPSRYISSSMSTQEDDTENRFMGNSSSRTSRLWSTTRIPDLEIQPYTFGSDDENLMQHLA